MAKMQEVKTVIFDKNLNRIIKTDKIFEVLFKNIHTLTEFNSFMAQSAMMNEEFVSRLTIKGKEYNLYYSCDDKEETLEFNFFVLGDNWSTISHMGCHDINDRLTGVLTEQNVLSLLKHGIKRTIRDKDTTTILLLDIRGLQNINEMFGYLAGDHVLKTVARTLEVNTRGSDALGRYKGDKFIIALHKTDAHGAMQYIKKFESEFNKINFEFNGFNFDVELSYGITICTKDDSISILVERLKKALKKAKKSRDSNIEFLL